jgi:sugar phosphate isomerase/epimerase
MDVAIRDAMVPKVEGRPFFQLLRDIGVSSVEIELSEHAVTPHVLDSEGKPYKYDTVKSTLRLKQRLDDEGVRCAAVLMATDFAGEHAERHVNWVGVGLETAFLLGAPVVRIDPLATDRSLPPQRVRDRFVDRVTQILGSSLCRNGMPADLGIENHGPVANDPAWLDYVLAALPHLRVGLTLDTGNFYWYGFSAESVYELVDKYAPAAKHTHLKNINYPADVAARRRETGYEYKQYCCPVHDGNLDLARVVRSLRGAGYERDLCIEDESLFKHPPEARVEVLRREVDAVRGAMAEAAA